MVPKNQIRIFIIEDNKAFAIALKEDIVSVFMHLPLQVFVFETGEECMEHFIEVRPHIVILDYYLNSKRRDAANGMKILDWIKKENPETFVIMLTSDDQVDIAVESFKHGATDYVVKSVTQFKKTIFSLLNIFKILEFKRESEKYLTELNRYYKTQNYE